MESVTKKWEGVTMKRIQTFYTITIIVVLLLGTSCITTQVDQEKIREAIGAVNMEFMNACSQGDAAGVAALYTEDGQVMAPNSDIVTGKEAIQGFFQAFMDMGIKSVKLETVEVESMGETAWEVGNYTLFGEGEQMMDTGKFIVIWKQVDGEWRLHRDIFNSNLPVPE